MKTIKVMALLALAIVSANILPVYRAKSERAGESFADLKKSAQELIDYYNQNKAIFSRAKIKQFAKSARFKKLENLNYDFRNKFAAAAYKSESITSPRDPKIKYDFLARNLGEKMADKINAIDRTIEEGHEHQAYSEYGASYWR